jgi:hypothetical protein
VFVNTLHPVYINFGAKPEGKTHTGDLGVDGQIILKWVLKKQGVKVWTG